MKKITRGVAILIFIFALCAGQAMIARALSLSGSALMGLSLLIESIAAAITVRNPSSSVTVTDVTTVVAPTVSTEGTGIATVSGIATGIALPETPVLDELFWLTSDGSPGICEAGGGTLRTLCYWDGDSWEPVIPPTEFTATDTLQSVVSRGGAVTTAITEDPVSIGGSTHAWFFYQDGAGVLRQRACTNDGATCFTAAKKLEVGSEWALVNENNVTCGSFNSVTMAWTPNYTGGCAPNFVTGVTTGGGLAAVTSATGSQVGIMGCAPGEQMRRRWDGTAWECAPSNKHTPNIPATDTYTMLDADCGTTIANSDADSLTVALLADPTGCAVCFFEESAQTIVLDTNGSDIFIVNGLTPTAGQNLTLPAAVGNNLCLHGKNASTWYVFLGTGVPTVTP